MTVYFHKHPSIDRNRIEGRCTWDIDESGVHFATFGRDEAFNEGGASSSPHPGQADLHKLQVDAQRVFPSRHGGRLLVYCTFTKSTDKRDDHSDLICASFRTLTASGTRMLDIFDSSSLPHLEPDALYPPSERAKSLRWQHETSCIISTWENNSKFFLFPYLMALGPEAALWQQISASRRRRGGRRRGRSQTCRQWSWGPRNYLGGLWGRTGCYCDGSCPEGSPARETLRGGRWERMG